ncbi:unnamed protein product, partial [Brachionus calyciflorus]
MASGYYQVKMDTKDKEKTAMATPFGLYHFVRIGLTNAPATFQRMRHMIYLGHVVKSGGLFPCEDNAAAIKAFKIPCTIKQLQSFLGLTGYYRKFIRDYSKIASPLFKATKKGKKFEFDKRCEDAFNKLKDCLTGTDLDGDWKPIAYWSRQLSKSEQNYSATEKEALAIVEAMEHFRVYLYGSDVLMCTDHQPLKWMMNVKDPQQRGARWINIAQLIEWKNLSDRSPDLKGLTGELRTHWLQWNRLTVINGVFYLSWEIDGDIVRYQYVVPINKRSDILKQMHEFGGHFGCVGTTGKVESKYYRPSQHKHIADYFENCLKCQESKTSGLMSRAPLQTIITSRPFLLEVLELLEVHKLRTTPYHPQCFSAVCNGYEVETMAWHGSKSGAENLAVWKWMGEVCYRSATWRPEAVDLEELGDHVERCMDVRCINYWQDRQTTDIKQCQYCKQWVTLFEFDDHVDECKWKECLKCGLRIDKMEEVGHLNQCEPTVVYLIACPLCPQRFEANELEEHWVVCVGNRRRR